MNSPSLYFLQIGKAVAKGFNIGFHSYRNYYYKKCGKKYKKIIKKHFKVDFSKSL